MRRLAPFGAVAALFITGCAWTTSPARQHQLEAGAPYWFDYDAGRRGAVLVPSRGAVRFCAEPSPDIALQQSVNLIARAETPQGISAQGQAKLSADVIAMAGRTQTVVFLREALYRLCEQSLNGNLSQAEIAPLFLKILESSYQIAQAQLASEIRQTPSEKLPAVADALTAAPPVQLPQPDKEPPELPPPIVDGEPPP